MSITRMARAGIALAIPLLTVALFLSQAGAQEGSTDDFLMKVTGPEDDVSKGDVGITVTISAENAVNLAAFGFELEYDPDVLQIATDPETGQPMIQRGDFLGSTGREMACPDPESQPGVLRMLCVTLRMEPPGPDGAGTLATVTFDAIGSGGSALTLDRVQANTPDGGEIQPIQVQSTTINVKGGGSTNWLLWGIIGGVAALAIAGAGTFALMRSGRPAARPPAQPPAP